MRISCSVVAYSNPPSQIANLLGCIAATEAPPTVYLVDNSPQDLLRDVAARFGAIYIHLPHNPGFGAAHNVAIGHALEAGAAYHAVLNPDISFGPEVFPALSQYMDEHPEVGMLMPAIRYPDGAPQLLCKLLPNPGDLLLRRFFPSLYRWSGRLARYELHESRYDRIMDVPVLSGCFMFLRATALRQAGGFDERFFMYLEDVDLSRRIGAVSRTVFFPGVSVVHEYGKGSYKNRKLLFYHLKSAILYFNKWGWFIDLMRRRINCETLLEIKKMNNKIYKIVK